MSTTFDNLVSKWKHDTINISSVHQIFAHPSCQEIIKMGHEVIPLILEELKEDPDIGWFSVLRAITGENPVPKEHAGRIQLMSEDWLEWGKQKGRIE